MTPQFHKLSIASVRPEAGDACVISFHLPPEQRDSYQFAAGQYLTLKAEVNGQALRRSYSICSTPQELAEGGEVRVGVKRVDGGLFSNYALGLKAGDQIDVMTPEGRFGMASIQGQGHLENQDSFAKANKGEAVHTKHFVAFVAGSGITPALSLIATLLADNESHRFTLVYGNRRSDTVMFLEELAALKNRYLNRFVWYNVLSRQPQEVELFNGRLDRQKIRDLTAQLIPIASIDQAFICGPHNMIDEVEQGLRAAGLSAEKIDLERFGVASEHRSAPVVVDDSRPAAQLTVVLDGKQSQMRLPFGNTKVLDVALAQGLDLPFACKGGVCCTCRAKVLEGEVTMEKNYTLEAHEIAKGFVLTCQAIAKSDKVVVSYDDR